jgi:hypothetical protein
MVKHEETESAKIASIAIALQFVCGMVNSLYRSDVTPVLCLIGFYAVQERKMNATRTVRSPHLLPCINTCQRAVAGALLDFARYGSI